MAALTSLALGAASAIGGVAGALGNHPDFNMQEQGALGGAGWDYTNAGLKQQAAGNQYAQQGLATQASALGQYGGPSDFTASRGGQQDLASLLSQYQQSGGVPSQADQTAAAGYAQNQFAQQRVNLRQTMDQQLIDANRQAALSGRGTNDPILRAKLAQEQTRQGASLDAAQQGFAGQYAQQISQQRLGYAEGRANVLTSMDQLNATNRQQAFANMFNTGAGLSAYGTQQQQFGMQQQQLGLNAVNQDFANRFAQASGDFKAQSAQKNVFDVIGGGLSGAVGGLGAGMSAASSFSKLAPSSNAYNSPNYRPPSDADMYNGGRY